MANEATKVARATLAVDLVLDAIDGAQQQTAMTALYDGDMPSKEGDEWRFRPELVKRLTSLFPKELPSIEEAAFLAFPDRSADLVQAVLAYNAVVDIGARGQALDFADAYEDPFIDNLNPAQRSMLGEMNRALDQFFRANAAVGALQPWRRSTAG